MKLETLAVPGDTVRIQPPRPLPCRSTRRRPTHSTTPSTAPTSSTSGCGQHLHPHHEPHAGRPRGTCRRNGRRRGCARRCVGHVRNHLRDPDHRRGRRQYRPASTLYGGTYNPSPTLFRRWGSRFASPTTATRKASSRSSMRAPRRSSANPWAIRSATSPTSRRLRAIAHRHGIPLDCRQYGSHALPVPPFEHGADIVVHSPDQIHERSRQLDRRRDRRFGQVSLGRPQGPLPPPERA